MENLIDTKGFDLEKVIAEARENGANELADVIEAQIDNLQTVFDVLGQRYTSVPDGALWNIDVEYLKGLLK